MLALSTPQETRIFFDCLASVVKPTGSTSEFLEAAVQSVLAQHVPAGFKLEQRLFGDGPTAVPLAASPRTSALPQPLAGFLYFWTATACRPPALSTRTCR